MLNTFEETFEVTEMRTFKHEPFFIVGGGGGGLFVVLYGTSHTSRDHPTYGVWERDCYGSVVFPSLCIESVSPTVQLRL